MARVPMYIGAGFLTLNTQIVECLRLSNFDRRPLDYQVVAGDPTSDAVSPHLHSGTSILAVQHLVSFRIAT